MAYNGSNPWLGRNNLRGGLGPLYLFYGIELELVLIPKSHTAKNWDDVAKQLSASLTLHGIRNEIVDDSKMADYNRPVWIITGDGSVKRDPKNNIWGFELISYVRIPTIKWKGICSSVWNALIDSFDLVESDTCGTHVHVSWERGGSKGGGAMEPLKRLAKAVVWFENCTDSLMPPHRLGNSFCRSNRWNVKLRLHTIREIMEMIDGIEEGPGTPDGSNDYKKLVDLLCPDDGNGTQRYYKWNFTPVLQEDTSKRTIEFRQPPGSNSLNDTIFWCQFVHAFVFGALHSRYWDPGWYDASLPELRRMLKEVGNEQPFGEYDDQLFEQAFKDKSLLPDKPYDEALFTEEEIARIRRKDQTEELKMKIVGADFTFTPLVTVEKTSDGDNWDFLSPGVFSDDEDGMSATAGRVT